MTFFDKNVRIGKMDDIVFVKEVIVISNDSDDDNANDDEPQLIAVLTVCAICLQAQPQDNLACCGQALCAECAEKWCVAVRGCPYCRAGAPALLPGIIGSPSYHSEDEDDMDYDDSVDDVIDDGGNDDEFDEEGNYLDNYDDEFIDNSLALREDVRIEERNGERIMIVESPYANAVSEVSLGPVQRPRGSGLR